jgi:hypothetical protein
MKCSECSNYSRALMRCTLGLVKPKTLTKAMNIAQTMGLCYICNKDGMKNKLIESLSKTK